MTVNRIIEDTRKDIIKKLREERFVETIGKIGFIGTVSSLGIITAVAACAILIRFLQMENIVLSAILHYGPGIAAVFGTVSSVATYYGWSRILRGKKKLRVREEGKSEVQNQLGEFIQSLPDMLGSFAGGCFSQASSTAAVSVSIAVSTVAYIPAVNEIFNDVVNAAEQAVVRVVKRNAEEPIEKEEEQIIEAEEEEIEKQRIAGKLNLRGGTGEKERVIVELMSGNEIAAWVFADSEGNYAFHVVPGDYTVRARLEGYESAYSTPFELAGKGVQISELTVTSMDYTEPVIEPKPVAKKEAIKVPAQPTPLLQSKAQPTETPLPPEPPPPKPRQQQQPAEAPKSGFFVGAGSELNNNSARKGSTAMGGNVVLGYDMNKNFALGLNTVYSHDMNVVSTLESMVMVRYYLPVTSSFLQAEAGGSLSTTEGKNSVAPLGGLTAGMRLEMENRWYLEPTLRGGYPFTWGAGVTLGKKFGQ